MKHHRLLLPTLCLALLASCSAPKAEKREPHGTVSVKVDAPDSKDASLLLAVYAPKNGERGPAIQTHSVKDGSITGFVLPLGQAYEFLAFVDVDNNRKPGPGEPSASLKGMKPDPNLQSVQPPLVITLTGADRVPTPRPEKKEPAAAVGGTGKPATVTAPKAGDKPADKSADATPAPPPVPPAPKK